MSSFCNLSHQESASCFSTEPAFQVLLRVSPSLCSHCYLTTVLSPGHFLRECHHSFAAWLMQCRKSWVWARIANSILSNFFFMLFGCWIIKKNQATNWTIFVLYRKKSPIYSLTLAQDVRGSFLDQDLRRNAVRHSVFPASNQIGRSDGEPTTYLRNWFLF